MAKQEEIQEKMYISQLKQEASHCQENVYNVTGSHGLLGNTVLWDRYNGYRDKHKKSVYVD